MANKYEGYMFSERLQNEVVGRALVRSQLEFKKEQENLEEFKKFNDRQGEACEDLKRENEGREYHYMNLNMFSRLAKLANDAIETIPTKLQAADAARHPLNTPSEVIAFVEFCKTMIRDFKEKIEAI
ncbi:hypothetical protein MTR_3g053440 [Medicago truncatula]|uniref:Uncharacterized protein n=1 Tax=Medicago truncatula TaxID=3880 RepID=A0A072V6X8_MEDTR|nr:hypothetical protein MTR_3g053440 [Medicago truncatula]